VQLALSAIEPAVLTAAVVAICLLLYRFLPKPWLFDLPAKRTPKPALEESQQPTQPLRTTSPSP
jgi:hypothetical protein